MLTSLLIGVLLVGSAAGCQRTPDVVPGDDWHPDDPAAPSLRPAFGLRVTDGELLIWTGSPCKGVTRLAVTLDISKEVQAETVFTAASGGATVERFTLGSVPTGMTLKEALPAGYSWATAKTVIMVVSGPPAWGAETDLEEVRAGSGSHPADTYYFQKVGWMNPAQVAAQDGKTFLATCTRDPVKG